MYLHGMLGTDLKSIACVCDKNQEISRQRLAIVPRRPTVPEFCVFKPLRLAFWAKGQIFTMDKTKYVGMDVHKETICVAVLGPTGKLIKEAVLETKANPILLFIRGLQRNVHVTFEEGTWAAWLYGLLQPHVARAVVCNPRRNALLNDGSKGDQTDARKLAELLRGNFLKPVYHGETGTRALKELTRSYSAISKDLIRVMNRLKAIYRGRGLACGGTLVYTQRHRSEWLDRIAEAGVRRRAELFYQQLDALQALRLEARRDLLNESRKHGATELYVRFRASVRFMRLN